MDGVVRVIEGKVCAKNQKSVGLVIMRVPPWE